MRRFGCALMLFMVAAPGALFAQTRAEELDEFCEGIAKAGFSGTVLAVRDGVVVLEKGYGLSNRDEGTANEPETRFEIASLSKQFTAAAILKLEQDGRLSTNDPIAKHLPAVPEVYAEVTVYHLLTHTGGLPRGGPGRGLDLETAVKAHLAEAPSGKPGERYAYSNVDYALLAGIVEVVSGTAFEAYCRKALFEPAGMGHTGFSGEAFDDAELALGYSGGAGPGRAPHVDPYPPLDEFGYEYRGMGGVVTTVGDLHRWTIALEDERVLSNASKERFFAPFRGQYACGWEVFGFPDGRRCIGHGGAVRGFVCKLWMFPDDRSLLVVLSNRDDFNYRWLNGMYDVLFDVPKAQRAQMSPPRPPSPPPGLIPGLKAVPATDAELDRMVGAFTSRGEVPLRLAVERRGAGVATTIAPPEQWTTPDRDPVLQPLAKTIIEGLVLGDVQPLADHLAPGIPPNWPEVVRTMLWPQHLQANGALERVEVLGTDTLPTIPGVVVVWVVLHHVDHPAVVMMGFRGKKLQLLVLDISEYFCAVRSATGFLKRENGTFATDPTRYGTSTISMGEDRHVRLQGLGIGLDFAP